MSSLAQLASNATDSNFTEYVFPDAVADSVPEVDPLEGINLSEEPDAKIKYDGQLIPALLYQIHMEYKIHGHREVDLCLSDDIHAVVQQHAENGLDFKSMKIVSRKNLLKRVAEVYNLTTLAPKIYKIKVQNNTLLTSVAVFNLRAQVLSILHNNELMQPHNFAPGYDIYTGKPTSPGRCAFGALAVEIFS